MFSGSLKLIGVLALAVTLAACKSTAERAEEAYQSGLALLEAGDPDRAMVEFRNVFELDPNHREARQAFAEVLLEQGDKGGAYRQYLRIAEQDPEDLQSRIVLSEIAFEARNWEELERHGAAAAELDADAPRVRAVSLARDYRAAVTDDEPTRREGLAVRAQELQAQMPENLLLRNVLIDFYSRTADYPAALAELDALIAANPDNREYDNQRVAVIAQTGDEAALETAFRSLLVKYPGDANIKAGLLRFYLGQGDAEKAEAFLREISDPADADPAAFVDLIRFVAEVRGPEAALVEIERAIAENPNPAPFRALRAGFDFTAGEQDKAIAELEEVLAAAEPSEQTNGIRITLARMMLGTGNEVGARRLVEETLTDDPSYAEALKMQASWQIDADDTDGAIASLRSALDSVPEDAQAMQLMAAAYNRAGQHDLARDFLALAVEASNNAPAESIRYARVLMEEERYLPAEDVLIPALRLAPGNPDLLAALGQLYLAMDDSARTRQVIDTLRRTDSQQTRQIANTLEAELLNRSSGTEDAVAFLEGLAAGEDSDLNAQLLLLRGRLATGDAEGALSLVRQLIVNNPDNAQLPLAEAATLGAVGDLDAAAAAYRDLLADNPAQPPVWLELSRILLRQGEVDAADATVGDGLDANPGDPNLLWARASVLERRGDIDGAITIYEDLYDRSSGSVVVANNLASLLSAYREDAESLERAYTIARRFSGAENPALQDTYGWIAYRRGEAEEALPYLESAAAGLVQDALTQYHLGMVYAALDRRDEAIAQLQKAIEIAGPVDTRPQIAAARAELARLQAEPGTANE